MSTAHSVLRYTHQSKLHPLTGYNHPCSHVYRNHPGIYINNFDSGSLADECKRLLVGDRILETNGYDIRHATIDEAAAILDVSSSSSSIIITVWLPCTGCYWACASASRSQNDTKVVS